MRGVGWEAHVTSRDPTLDAGRASARSGVACPKNVLRQYLTYPSELVPHLFALLTFNIVQSSEDFHAAILVSCSTSALQAAIKAVMIRRAFCRELIAMSAGEFPQQSVSSH
jgi:hypothetical protein